MRNDRYVPSVHAILQSGNLFVYTMNNPVRWIDPNGTFAVCPWAIKYAVQYLYIKAKPYIDPVYQWAKPKVVNVGTAIKNDALAVGRWVQGHAARHERWVVNTFNSLIGRGGTPSVGVPIGTDFGRLGVLIENKGTQIVNWSITTTHGMERMAERGVTQGMVNEWVRTGHALQQSGGQTLFITQQGAVAVTPIGQILTAYTSTQFDANMLRIIEMLFGG